MTQRSLRERIAQSILFETLGLALVTPLYLAVFDRTAGEGLLVAAVVSLTVVVWLPVFNALFDAVEMRRFQRVASDRAHRGRLLHAGLQEFSTTVVTVPIIMGVGGHGLGEALLVELALVGLYAAYAYVFFLLYDTLRPIPSGPTGGRRPPVLAVPTALVYWHEPPLPRPISARHI